MNSNYVDLYARFQKILFNPRAMEWMSYEWSHDDRDDEFFNKGADFEQWLREFFPQLKTRQLTRAEWRRIRKYVNRPYKRLFSSKYLREKRDELCRFRSGNSSIQSSGRKDGSNAVECDEPSVSDLASIALTSSSSTCDEGDIQSIGEPSQGCASGTTSFQMSFVDDSDNHLFRLLVETSNYLSSKTVILNKMKQLMKPAQAETASQTVESGKLIMELYNLNTDILANFEKLWHFPQVKTTLLFSSSTRIKADLFYQKCQLAIHQKYEQLQVGAVQDYQILSAVIESLLSLAYMLTDSESHSKETFTEILTEELEKLKMLCGDEAGVFEQDWFSQLWMLFTKSNGATQDIDKNIMQYIS